MKSKGVARKIVAFIGILVFVIGAVAYGCQGPCGYYAGGCGGESTGSNTCVGSGPYCNGSCPWYCAAGDGNWYCVHLVWRCGEYNQHCSQLQTQTCRTVSGGGCTCVSYGITGYYCWRYSC